MVGMRFDSLHTAVQLRRQTTLQHTEHDFQSRHAPLGASACILYLEWQLHSLIEEDRHSGQLVLFIVLQDFVIINRCEKQLWLITLITLVDLIDNASLFENLKD